MSKKANKKKQDHVKIDARLVSATDEEWEATNQKLCDHIFKGRSHITFKEFSKLRHDIKDQLTHYEFHMFTNEDSKMTMHSFLFSMLSCIDTNKQAKYARRINKICHELSIEDISLKEFMAFNEFMAHNNLAGLIQQYRYIDYDQFHELCTKFNK